MEYAISAAVVALFAAIYLLAGRREKPLCYELVGEDDFEEYARRFVTLPDGRSALWDVATLRRIKWCAFKAGRGRYAQLSEALADEKQFLLEVASLKEDGSLPSVKGEPRALILARAALCSTGGEFSAQRVEQLFSLQNAAHTLTYEEISSMKSAFQCAVAQQLSRLISSYDTLVKARRIAARYVAHPRRKLSRHSKLMGSPLFLGLCARIADYRADEFSAALTGVTRRLDGQLATLRSSYAAIKAFDFSRHYTPLEIYCKYDVFEGAGQDSKHAFLTLAGKLSDRENVDEFIYAVRVDKYMHSASSGHMDVKRLSLIGRRAAIISQREDISMLAAALGSRYFMQLFFASSGKSKFKSISKNGGFENSFEPVYRFHTVNFGISTKGGRLKLSPHLPPQVLSADVVFAAGDNLNTLHIERGEERALFLGGAKLKGTDEIRLGGQPIEVTMILPYD